MDLTDNHFVKMSKIPLEYRKRQSTMIHVIATLEVAPGTREAFLEHFHKLVPTVLAEAGCIGYGPAVDVDANLDVQIGPRENVVTVVEAWESVEALHAHLAAPHMLEYRDAVKDMLVDVKIQVMSPA